MLAARIPSWQIALLILGGVTVSAGSAAGFSGHASRAVVLLALGIGVTLFVATLVLPRVFRSKPGSGSPVAAPAEIPTGRPATVRTATPLAIAAPRSALSAEAVREVASPLPDVAQAKHVASRQSAEPVVAGGLDVTTLMQAPLVDLLLAAVCKDADGARRIFREALNQEALVAPDVSNGLSSPGAPPAHAGDPPIAYPKVAT